MKPDFYTRAVLTVIALALVVLCFEKNVVPANAAQQIAPQAVVLVGLENMQALPVEIHYPGSGGASFIASTYSPLPVQNPAKK